MTPEEIQLCQRGLRSIINNYGRLVAKNPDGCVIDSGSAIFLEIDNIRLIGTADHVADDLSKKGQVYLQVFRSWATDAPEVASPPLEFLIDPAQRLQLPRGRILDVAALLPPSDLTAASLIKWFDAQKHAESLRYLRQEVAKNTDPRLAAIIVGFPRFTRFEDAELHVQASGSIAIWGILQQITDPPVIMGQPPQVIMEIDPPSLDSLPVDTPPLFRLCVQNFSQLLKSGYNVLGGYSGGPVIYFSPKESVLVGIMKEAGLRLGGQAFATPIDVFVQEVRQAQS